MSNETIVRISADASGYEAGVERAKRSAESFLTTQEAAAKRTKAAQDAITEAAVNGSKASASAINSFVQSTARLADTVGKTRSQMLEQKAAQLGVTEAMSGYIAKIKEAERAHGEGAEAAHKLNFATAGARRELLVLAHEASQGNWKRFAGSLMVLGERTDAMSMIMNKTVLSIGAMVGAVAMAAAITYKAAEAMGAYGDEIDRIAKKTGGSTDAIQQWSFAARASGVDAKETIKSFGDLGEVQNKAIHGNKDAAAAFQAIGISLKDLKNSSPEELIPRIADAFHESADSASKAAVATSLPGASGENLIPLLDRGSAGLAALGREAASVGAIIGGDTIRQMAAFKEHMDLAHARMEALSMSAKTQLLPTILNLTEAMGSNVAMKPLLEDFYKGVGVIIKAAASAVATLVVGFQQMSEVVATIATVVVLGAQGEWRAAVAAAQNGYNNLKKQGEGYAQFMQKLWSDTAPPVHENGAVGTKKINFAKGGHHQEKAYHDDAATRFLQQLRDQDAAVRAALSSNEKLTGAEKQQAEFIQKIADLKERKILTADEKSLIAAEGRIKAQFAINVAHERELKLKEDIQKMDERAAQIRAQMGNYQRSQSEQHQRELDAFGMGKDALAKAQAVKSIYAEYDRQREQLEHKASEGARKDPKYLQAQADIQAGLEKSLQDYDTYYATLKEKQADWLNGATAAFANYMDGARNMAAQTEALVNNFAKGMEDALVRFASTGKLSFKSLADSIIVDINRMAVKAMAGKFFEMLGGINGGTGVLGLIGDAAGMSIGGVYGKSTQAGLDNLVAGLAGQKAVGGAVEGRMPYLVGERGPEIFVPKSAGNIVPNHALRSANDSAGPARMGGGIQQNVNMNISVPPMTGYQTAAQMGSNIAQQLQMAIRRNG